MSDGCKTGLCFEATVSFELLVKFSFEHMYNHAADSRRAHANLVYLLDRYDGSMSMCLVTKDGVKLTSDPLCSLADHRLYDKLGSWSGYSADCAFNFRWQSCSGTVLTAYRTDDGAYRLECVPSGNREGCSYMAALQRFGAQWRQIAPPAGEEVEVEPEWYGRDMDVVLGRLPSGC